MSSEIPYRELNSQTKVMFNPDFLNLDAGSSPLMPITPETEQTVVFDVDNTLLHCVQEAELESIFRLRPDLRENVIPVIAQDQSDGTVRGLAIVRPGVLTKLIPYCRRRFRNVGIWSAGMPHYVLAMSKIFQKVGVDHFTAEDFLLDRYDCSAGIDGKEAGTKHLLKLYNQRPTIRPESTFIVDDRATSFHLDPQNGIYIPAFNRMTTLESLSQPDDAFDRLIAWWELPEVKNATDVRTLDKSRIFA